MLRTPAIRLYAPMSEHPHASLAFQAARALIFEGAAQPNGYTEPLLHRFRADVKLGNEDRGITRKTRVM